MDKESIRSVIESQKKEIKRALGARLVKRESAGYLKGFLESDLIKVIIGVRRCGKSTLALQALEGKKYAYVNFDDERFLNVKASDLDPVLEALYETYGDFEYLLLDEVQNVVGWELFVSRLRREGINLIVTGSSARLLSAELATHLTGRHISFELFPFSFKEFLEHRNPDFKQTGLVTAEDTGKIKKLLAEYLAAGGFPESYASSDPNKYLRDLYNSILTRDVLGRHGIRHVNTLTDIVSFLVSSFSSPMSYAKTKKAFDLKSIHTVKNYFSYAEESYLIFSLQPFSFKVKEQVRMPRKTYVVDTGLITAIGFPGSENRGRLMENAVFSELMRRKSFNSLMRLNFFRDYQGREVDFVVRDGLKITELIQACYDATDQKTRKRETDSLLKASEELKCRKLTILTWDHECEETHGRKKISFTPVWKWMLEGKRR